MIVLLLKANLYISKNNVHISIQLVSWIIWNVKFKLLIVPLIIVLLHHQLACPSFIPEPEEFELLSSTHLSAYLVTISNDMPATNPAGINTPPETHRLPMMPANTAATANER